MNCGVWKRKTQPRSSREKGKTKTVRGERLTAREVFGESGNGCEKKTARERRGSLGSEELRRKRRAGVVER